MTAAAALPGQGQAAGADTKLPLLVALAALVVMYAPAYWSAARVLWTTDENGHGPLVLAVVVWLFWSVRESVLNAVAKPVPGLGWSLFGVGLLGYTFGRVLDVSSAEFISQIFVVAGGLLLIKGWSGLGAAWFPVLYLVFLVPLPATLVDAMTGPLKHWISVIVQNVLYAVGYPITNSGVILTIGQYQLMVADACSGLNSMFSLSALGTLFMYMMKRKSLAHNAIMLASILPIAFIANIVRVMTLVLVTYHLGDEAGQGFLHGAAGIVLMLVALLTFFALDAVLAIIFRERAASRAPLAR